MYRRIEFYLAHKIRCPKGREGSSPSVPTMELRNINDAIATWHDREDLSMSLHEYVGMSFKTFGRWVTSKMSAEELATYGWYDE